MTTKEIAKQLDGAEYPFDVPKGLAVQAKEAGIVIVCGASDDLMEFYGAFRDEVGAYDGTTVTITPTGLQMSWQDVLETQSKDKIRAWFASEGKGSVIEAIWDKDGYSFQYKTNIPHETFEVMEDGDTYCRGIVFRLEDLVI
jgi:hypothetical protein